MLSISTILFSRDRAMQLNAVLRSFFLHCRDDEPPHVAVLYRVSDEKNARQYQALKNEYSRVTFVEQQNFRKDVLKLLNPYAEGSMAEFISVIVGTLISLNLRLERLPLRYLPGLLARLRTGILQKLFPTAPDDQHLLFLVDDNLFVRDFSIQTMTNALQAHPDALGFSLRLGKNTTYCYAVDQPQALPEFTILDSACLKFNWSLAELDFAYPLEVSSSIYRGSDLFPLIAVRAFSNPNELEYQIAVSAKQFTNTRPFLLCAEQSCTFCNPLNLVQNFAPNRASGKVEYTSERLADLFEQGYRIDVAAYTGFVPRSCHQEATLEFFQPEKSENETAR